MLVREVRTAHAQADGTAGARVPALSAEEVLRQVALVREVLADVRAAAGASGGWGRGRREVLLAVQGLDGAVQVTRSAWLAVEAAAGTSRRPADRSDGEMWSRMSGTGLSNGRKAVAQAETVLLVPTFAAAVEQGRVPAPHLDEVAKVLPGAAPAVVAELTSPAGQEALAELAERHDPRTFARHLAAAVARLDPVEVQGRHDAQRRGRYLHLSETDEGTVVKGRLDARAGDALRRALELVGGVPDEERSAEQVRADALETLALVALSSPTAGGSTAQVRPHVTIVMDASTFAAAQAALDEHEQPTRVAAMTAAVRGLPPVADEEGTPLPLGHVWRVLCDAEVSRLVVGADSVPLDIGRTQRTFCGPHRRAVVVRDQRCTWPGCSTPARWCEVHHIRWWSRGGVTSTENGVVLCAHHHHQVHTHDIAITRIPGPRVRGRGGAATGARPRPGYEFRQLDGRLIGGGRSSPGPNGGDRGRAAPGRHDPTRPRRAVAEQGCLAGVVG